MAHYEQPNGIDEPQEPDEERRRREEEEERRRRGEEPGKDEGEAGQPAYIGRDDLG